MSSCTSKNSSELISDKAFDQFKENFVEAMWQLNPMWATESGYHRYDSILEVNDSLRRKQIIDFSDNYLDSLKKFESSKLSPLNNIDYRLIENYLLKNKFYVNELKSWEWDPSTYNAIGNVAYMLSEPYEPLEKRLLNIDKKLQQFKPYYAAAIHNISNPSAEHLQLAVEQNTSGMESFAIDLNDSIKICSLDTVSRNQLLQSLNEAQHAVTEYVQYLKALSNETPRSFRLGKDLYTKKFDLEIQSRYSWQQIYDSAQQRKNYLHDQMFKLTAEMWPKYFNQTAMPSDRLKCIKMMIDTLSSQHVKPEEFQATIEKQIPELEHFVTNHDLIYLDPSKPLKVRKEPAYMAGVAGASISAPGPYDKNGNTYYNVGSLNGWNAERAESYLREYNHYILQILNIHEAIPGHYTQLVYSNNAPSIIKSILGNGAMIEGWAVYGELMMLENGYGNQQPEMWLMYYKWNLRAVCNTLLDIAVHTGAMTKPEALDLLVRQAFQQQAEAEGKWRRVQLTNVQLTSYYTGFKEIYDLREELKNKQSDQFKLKTFHESFLSYGSAPVKMIREQLLTN